ncbi:Integral membrane protein with 6 transmembrane domains and possible ring domain [Cryptosporidium felis]|nr:Integral membrane protein with 6 transmembrane domains and possible ring domain [Cryptosporidium felis]
MGVGVLRSTVSWCLISDVIIRMVYIIGLLSRGISMTMLITYTIVGVPDLKVPLVLITGTVIFQVLFASFSSSLRCPWIILRFLFLDIWVGLLLFQIFLRISLEGKYYHELSNKNLSWETSAEFHGNLASITEKFQQIPSWWVVFWPCWFWCGIIFSFSTIFCVLGVTDRVLALFGIFFGSLSSSIFITFLDLAEFLGSAVYMTNNRYTITYQIHESDSHLRLWHICAICTQVMITVMSAIITQGLIEETNEEASGSGSPRENIISSNIKNFGKSISPFNIGLEIILKKRGTGVFHTIEIQDKHTPNKDPLGIQNSLSKDSISCHTTSTTNSPTSAGILTPKLSQTPKSKREFIRNNGSKMNSYDGYCEYVCIICCDNNPEAVFLPCGHGGICSKCALREFYRVGLCPTCRQPTSAIAAYKKQPNCYNSEGINAVIIATQET